MASKLIPFAAPETENTIPLITKSIFSNKVYSGSATEELEAQFAKYIGTKYAVSFASGRYASYLLYKYYAENKTVTLPAYTCIAAVDSARWAGCKPHFLDIDLDTYNPKFKTLKKNLGAITLSYLYGLIGDIKPFIEFSQKHNIPIIEDAAIAIGGTYKNKKVGSIGDAAMFSFQSSKILTGWRGGMVTTNDSKLYEFLLEQQKNQFKPPFLKLIFNTTFTHLRKKCSNPIIYKHTMYPLKQIMSKYFKGLLTKIINQNPQEAADGLSPEQLPNSEKYKFTNLQSAIVLSSFNKIDSILEKRRKIAKIIINELKDEEISLPKENKNVQHTYGRFPIRINGLNKAPVMNFLLKNGIETSPYYPYITPNTQHMKKYNFKETNYPNALLASKETLLLPSHTSLKKEDILYMVNTIKNIIKRKKEKF